MNNKSILIVAATGTTQYAKTLSQALNIPMLEIETALFPNEELKIRIQEAANTTILIGSLSAPVNNRIMEYILAADALKRLGCQKLVGILSWYAYSKQDKVFLSGEPLSAKVIANILQDVAIEELYTLELHSPAICDFFKIPVTNISAKEIFIDYFKNSDLSNTISVSPDTGSIKNAEIIANRLGIPLVHASKTRDRVSGMVNFTGIDGDVSDKKILIFDDMIATGSTLVEISKFLHDKNALNITVCATHHLYVPGAQPKLDASFIDKVIVTNSIQPTREASTSPKLTVVDVSPVLIKSLAQYKQ
jgi:ribose-phosphate pyrophosphokinase